MQETLKNITPSAANQFAKGSLTDHLGIIFTSIEKGKVTAELPIRPFLLAPNSYLHAGSVITLADSAAGFGCMVSLPDGATGFTTIELKSNHLGTAREGTIYCTATIAHGGKSTQVWDAVVKNKATDQVIAMFRCTQMILYPKQ
jgi:1,4-dihydroxy-2-naphthoyl-CoA hydrolase